MSGMTILLGKDVLLYVGGNPIAASRSCKLTLKTSGLETTSFDSGAFVSRIAGLIDWTMTVDGLTIYGASANFYLLVQALINRQLVTVKFGGSDGVVQLMFSGSALVSDLVQTANNNDVSAFSCSLQGAGPLAIGYVKMGGSYTPSFSGSFPGGG